MFVYKKNNCLYDRQFRILGVSRKVETIVKLKLAKEITWQSMSFCDSRWATNAEASWRVCLEIEVGGGVDGYPDRRLVMA